jgi:peptidoglycan/xylan/chitin deacetylase (PgdA/CDA1 family)
MLNEISELSLGLVRTKEPHFSICKEILNHQGIIFKEIDNGSNLKYPCIIIPYTDGNDYSLIEEKCLDSKNIIDVQKSIDIDLIFRGLSGFLDELFLKDELMDPILSRYEVKILNLVRKAYFKLKLPLIRKWFWPNFAQACCVISHDIDDLNILDFNANLIKNPIKILKTVGETIVKKGINKNYIPDLLNIEKQNDIKATYYFLPNYGKYQRYLPDIIKNVHQSNHEIGLHGDLHSAYNPKKLNKEKEVIEKIIGEKIQSGRQHGLHFLTPQSWKYYENIGMTNDSTFYYNDEFGFRGGICLPYHPFDVITNKRINLLEIPMAFMDWTGLNKNLDIQGFQQIIDQLKKAVEEFNGCLVMNFHNRYFDPKNYPQIIKIFNNILEYTKREKYWMATAKECANWWLKREKTKMEISKENGNILFKTTNLLPILIEKAENNVYQINPKSKEFKFNLEENK